MHGSPDLYLDAMDSTHFSRYFNHDQFGNLNFSVDVEAQRIDFFTSRQVHIGDELTFDCVYTGIDPGTSHVLS